MSHEIEQVNGQAQMAYVGDVPWHGLGVQLEADVTPNEMMVAAGLDWSVNKQDVVYVDPNTDEFALVPGKKALVRSSDGRVLDVVSDNWNPVQNEDVFEFFNEYVEAGGMEMHTAGSLKDGKIIWALAKVNESFSLFGGKDEVESYLLLSNPHQFGRGVDIRFTPIRVVCNNTLTMSLTGRAKQGITLSHRTKFDPVDARLALEEASSKMDEYRQMAEFLGTKRYKQDDLFEYFNRVFPKTNAAAGVSFEEMMKDLREGGKPSRNAELAMEVIDEQPGAEFGKGTWWSAYNAVTYMTNHLVGHNADTRLQSTWFGQNKNRNIDALAAALQYAEAA